MQNKNPVLNQVNDNPANLFILSSDFYILEFLKHEPPYLPPYKDVFIHLRILLLSYS